MTLTRPKYRILEALEVARELKTLLLPFCDRIQIAGSIRRRRQVVGDVELVFIPKRGISQRTFFGQQEDVDLVTPELDALLKQGVIHQRHSATGHAAWGPKNKLAIHVASGIPVDFFATNEANWVNTLFIRTGGKETNLKITTAANARGYSFEAYGSGFKELRGEGHVVNKSDQDIFNFCQLPYLEPWLRP